MGKIVIALLLVLAVALAFSVELGSGDPFRRASGEAAEQPSPSQKISEKLSEGRSDT